MIALLPEFTMWPWRECPGEANQGGCPPRQEFQLADAPRVCRPIRAGCAPVELPVSLIVPMNVVMASTRNCGACSCRKRTGAGNGLLARMAHDTGDDRMTTAEQLAGHDPRAAAEAFSAIARDQAVGDEVRLSAAEQLAAIDRQATAETFRGIPDDRPRHGHPFEKPRR